MSRTIAQYDVFLVPLDTSVGSEMRKTRPCVVVSPDEMNELLRTVIVAPMTSSVRHVGFRVTSRVGGQEGEIALDQLRTVDRSRLVRRLDRLDDGTAEQVARVLVTMFRH